MFINWNLIIYLFWMLSWLGIVIWLRFGFKSNAELRGFIMAGLSVFWACVGKSLIISLAFNNPEAIEYAFTFMTVVGAAYGGALMGKGVNDDK